MGKPIDLTLLFAKIGAWQMTTFPDADVLSCLLHLQDEMLELEDEVYALRNGLVAHGAMSKDVAQTREALAGELADVVHLCIALAAAAEVHLPTAILKKFEQNKDRTFTYDPDRGYMKGD